MVACHNTNGEPDFFFCKVKATQDDIEKGKHYAKAQEAAERDGYSNCSVVFDELDRCPWLFEHFVWESASLI